METLLPFCTVADLKKTWSENRNFFLPRSHLAHLLGMTSFDFVDEFYTAKSRLIGLSGGEGYDP